MSSSGRAKNRGAALSGRCHFSLPLPTLLRALRHGRVEILEPILRALWIRLASVAIFLDNSARPSPALIGIVSAMTRRGRSAVAKSRPAGEPEGRDARSCANPGFAQNTHLNGKSRRLN